MGLPRMTTRRIMVAVAIVAVSMSSAARAVRRWRYCRMTAEAFAYLKKGFVPNCFGTPLSAEEQRARDMEWQREMARQEAVYRRAAWHFWEPIPPSSIDRDPPPP